MSYNQSLFQVISSNLSICSFPINPQLMFRHQMVKLPFVYRFNRKSMTDLYSSEVA